jgi:UDP-3-O-[3-hydroxymyristoyl] N-acetylglucosamine deacetylase / 3-hydroxyacyl-[acyl-carrier-protein] dehydratase
MSTPKQTTIAEPRAIEGIGLHSGRPVKLRILPAEPHAGVRFRRTDLDGRPEIPARLETVVDVDRGTTLEDGGARIRTVEHVLSAIVGAGVDNLVVELDSSEPPAADGSAREFFDLIVAAGVQQQNAPARIIEIAEAFSFDDGESGYVVSASESYEVSASIRFDHPSIGRQFASVEVTPESYGREVAGARTFGFVREVEDLRSRGLAMGGSVENAVVLSDTGLYEGVELRFPDEFVRHKVLDLVGDLCLLGGRLHAHVVAMKPSHRGNVALGREIAARAAKAAGSAPKLDVQKILEYLPHRYPFLLVDRVVEFEERRRIVGLKNVTINEPFFVGHFPGHPIMPGVLIIEAMAQTGGLLLMDALENPETQVVYFMALDKVKWRRPVTPGDQIRFEVEVLQIRGRTARMKGVGTVDGNVVAEAEMMARVVDR